jgi:hypothetical protein
MSRKYKKFELQEGWYRIDELMKGEIVKRGPGSKKMYIVGNYDRQVKAYEMDHADDISIQSLVRGSTKVWAGFEY